MYTFIGTIYKNQSRKFKTHDGYILTFNKPLPNLYPDTMYVILCDRDPVTKLFILRKCRFWWGSRPEN